MVSFGQGVCILSTRFDCREREKKGFRLQRIFHRDAMYALYILFKLLLRHLLPVVLVLLCLFRPRFQPLQKSPPKTFFRTFAAKRISLIFLGEPAVCECGPSGAELTRPHECPKMARWSNFCNFGGINPNKSYFFGFQVETRHLEGHREQAGRENAAPRLSSLHRGEDQEVLARPPRRPGELPT